VHQQGKRVMFQLEEEAERFGTFERMPEGSGRKKV
jgi:hypothetical protein